jgi:flagellar motility protein MotE (MotC chaperone)
MRSVTALVVLILTISAMLRIGGIGTAWATSASKLPERYDESPVCAPVPAIAASLAAVRQREERADERSLQLDVRAQDLSVAAEAIRKQLTILETAEASLAARMAASSTASEDDLSQLTAVYEAMKPKVAAELFQAMEPEFAAGFLARMSPAAAAAVFSGLTPEAAYALSVVLAGRNANAVKGSIE